MALPLVSGFTLLPLFGLALRTYGRRPAAWAVALYPLVPSFALWSGRWEQFYPLLAGTCWYFFHVGLTESRRSAMLAAGFTLSIASLFNFSSLALLVPMGCFTLLWFLTQPSARLSMLKPTICGFFAFLVGLASLWIIYQVAFGTGFLDIWRMSMSYHLGLNRSYWTWLGYHLYDFLVFLGLPLAFSFLVALIKGIRDVRHQRYDMLSLGFGLGLLLLDLSGTSRGEVARVWLFLTPFAVLVAIRGLTRMRLGRWSFTVIVCLMVLQLFTFNTFLRVVTTGLTDPPVYTRIFKLPPISHPLSARFRVADSADSIALLGYDLEPDAPTSGDTLHLTLYWQALKQISQPYTVFTHLVGPDGRLVGQQDNMPLHNTLPTTCWVPGEIIADPYDIPVSRHTPAGNYVLGTGIYRWETGERLAATGPTVTPDHWVVLTQVVVAEEASVP
jgi:hypothetical protein